MIIIIGDESEFHAKYVFDYLKNKKHDAVLFDSRIYPEIRWTCCGENDYITIGGNKIFTRDIQGIYWRWYYGIYGKTDIIFREKESLINDFLLSVEDKCFNSVSAINLHKTKGFQSKIMADNGIRIPKTMITNDKLALEEFYFNNNKNIIYKPVRGGAYTKKFNDEDLLKTDLLVNCPCQLQEFIDGTDIRVYAFDSGEIYAAEIQAKDIDFREDTQAKIIPVNLPEKVQKECLKVLKLLKLKYSGIDIRKSKEGEYVFIEANPAPMFYYFEKQSGYPITETLTRRLSAGGALQI